MKFGEKDMRILNKIVTNMEITQSDFIKIPKGSITGISLNPVTKYTTDRIYYYSTHNRFLLFPIPHRKEMPEGFYDEELNNLFFSENNYLGNTIEDVCRNYNYNHIYQLPEKDLMILNNEIYRMGRIKIFYLIPGKKDCNSVIYHFKDTSEAVDYLLRLQEIYEEDIYSLFNFSEKDIDPLSTLIYNLEDEIYGKRDQD